MSRAGDAVEALITIVSRLQRLTLWPPADAAQVVVDAVRHSLEVAASPPGPHPDVLLAGAASWRKWGQYWIQAQDDATTTRVRCEPVGVWDGEAGDAFRSSMSALVNRFESVDEAAASAEKAFEDCAGAMAKARERHTAGQRLVEQHRSISWWSISPWELVNYLRKVIGDIIEGIEDLIGAYRDAEDALDICARLVLNAIDQIDLPAELADTVPAVQQVNQFGGGAGDDQGPLRGSTVRRADEALADMSPTDRAAAQALLDGASGPEARAWILAAIASGLTKGALSRYAAKVDEMTTDQLEQLDPLAHSGTFTQPPGGTTCGSSSLVMARMVNDPAFAMSVITGYDPRTNDSAPITQTMLDRFREESEAMHDQTNGLTSHDGGLNGPWPEALGTTPGSAARQMSGGDGSSGVPGVHYDVQYVDAADRGRTYDAVLAAVEEGHAIPIYTYDLLRNESGAHVTLAVGTQGDALMVYNPQTGATLVVSRDEFSTATLAGDLGWNRPMAAVLPG